MVVGSSNSSRILVTGANGFLGSRITQKLVMSGKSVVAFQRSRNVVRLPDNVPGSLETAHGDILVPDSYKGVLSGVDTVLHLAAATGKASPGEHHRVNVEGTRLLAEECRREGVARFLYVSSIAVKFPNKHRYHYAQAKAGAEQVIRASGIPYTIIRPTIIVGEDSAAFKGLVRLAGMAVLPVFGDGTAKVQPVHVDDLVEFLMYLVDHDGFRNEILEFGGPDVLTVEDFLKQIRFVIKGHRGRSIHFPLEVLVPVLSVLETIAYRYLPVTVGQLASFRNDGVAESNSVFEEYRDSMKTVPQMLDMSLRV